MIPPGSIWRRAEHTRQYHLVDQADRYFLQLVDSYAKPPGDFDLIDLVDLGRNRKGRPKKRI